MRDPITNLEHIRVKPLSEAEQASVWLSVRGKLAAMPTESPFSLTALFRSKALAYAFAFVVIVGTVGASNGAAPGSPLFPVDLAVERVERAIAPASRADHARERLSEFDAALGVVPTDGDADYFEAPAQENAVPGEAMMRAFTVSDDVAQQKAAPARELPPDVQAKVDATRRELLKLEAEATLNGNAEILAEIQAIIAAFEAQVQTL